MTNPFNPDAGDVPAPSDSVEVELAMHSARVLWRAVPYFAARYAERGARFGKSDVGWLVVIAHRSEQVHTEQVLWLAGLLAARGMPSWLLELQLGHLARAGRRVGWTGAAVTQHGADVLANKRRVVLDDALLESAGDVFAKAVGAVGRRVARGTGKLIASAHADVGIGLCRSTDPLLSWLCAGDDDGPIASGAAQVGELMAQAR